MNDAQLKALLETGPPTTSSGRKRPDEREPCVQCRMHAARVGEERAGRYYPALGLTIAVPTTSGGVVYLCPRCSTFEHEFEDGKRETTLLELGLISRREIRRRRFRLVV